MRISDWSSDVCSSDLSGTDPDATICQTRPRFGSQVARMKTASPTADARMTYRASVKTCLSARPTMVSQFSLSARSMIDLTAPKGWAPLIGKILPLGLITSVDRKSVVSGKRVSERVDLGGGGIIKKNKMNR